MPQLAAATREPSQQGHRRFHRCPSRRDDVTPPSRAPDAAHHRPPLLFHPILLVTFVAIAFAAATEAAQPPTPATTATPSAPLRRRFKSCFLLFATLDDLGYTFSQNLGRMNAHHRLAERFPDTEIVSVSLPRSFFMNHTELLHGMVRSGCNVIHGTSGGFQGPFRPFVFLYPNVTFTVQTAFYETPYAPNVVTFGARSYKPWYVAGRIAAKESKTGRIGFIAAWINKAEVLAGLNAFIAGVADENATMLPVNVVSTESWWNPDRERLAVAALHQDTGCDIVGQFTDSFVAAEYANSQDDGFFSIQMHGQATRYYGDAVLTCVYSDWSLIYEEIEAALIQGQRPNGYMLSDDVARLCDVSSRAPAATIRYGAAYDVRAATVFPGWSDADIRNISGPDVSAGRSVVHTPMPDPAAFCRVGTYMTYHGAAAATGANTTTSPSSSARLGPACIECPENTESTDARIACTPCVDGLIAARGAGKCVVPPSEEGADVGAIVGGVLASAVVMVVVFIVLAVLQSRRHASAVRDTTFAPRSSPATLIFTDIEGSTGLWCEDPDAMSDALDVHNGIMREAIKAYEAYEVKTAGDSFMIACGDPLTAIKLSVDIQKKILAHQWSAELPHPVRVRIGFAHGPVDVVFDEQSKGYDYYGSTVNLAARCEAAGDGGQTFYPLDTPLTTAELAALGAFFQRSQ